MTTRSLVVALAVLLIASGLMVLAPSFATAHSGHPAASSPLAKPTGTAPLASAAHPSANLIQIYTYDGYGYYDSNFYPGEYAYDTLYFTLYDPTADSSVNVTITDPNATRDGVPTPAFSANVPINTTTHYYYSYKVNVSYTFAASIKIGGTWNFTANATAAGPTTNPLYINTFYVDLSGNPRYGATLLPGETVTVTWSAWSYANGGAYNDLTNLSFWGTYLAGTGNTTNLFAGGYHNVSAPAPAIGSFQFTLPVNATGGTYFYIYLDAYVWSNNQVAEVQFAEMYYYVGQPWVYVIDAAYSGGNCAGATEHYFSQGEIVPMCVELGAMYISGGNPLYFSPIAGLTAKVTYWDGPYPISAPSGWATSVTSNQTGWSAFNFPANTPPFTQEGNYPSINWVRFNVTDTTPTAPGNWSGVGSYWFYIYPSAATGNVQVSLNQLSYYPGQAITATWNLGSSNTSQTGTLTASDWWLYGNLDQVLASGVITSTNQSGSFTVPIPAGYTGIFYLYVDAVNASTSFEGEAVGYVLAPTVVISSGSVYYASGSTVHVTFYGWGTGSAGGSIEYTVWASYPNNVGGNWNDGIFASGTVANDSSVPLVIPSTSAPYRLEIQAWLVATDGTVLAQATSTISEEYGYQVLLGVQTASGYSDGSYQPGQTITVSYSLVPIGGSALPATYTYAVSLYNMPVETDMAGTGSSGTFQLTLPSNLPSGIVFIEMSIGGSLLNQGSCYYGNCFGETAVTVNAHPSVLSMDVAPGSGLTVGWLILIVVIILVALLLYVLIRRRRSASPPPTMPPAAPAPSSPAPPEWKEPPASSNQQPPMPSPPPGAQ